MSHQSLQKPNATASMSGTKRSHKPKPDNSIPSFKKHATPPSKHGINHRKKTVRRKYPALTIEDADAGVWPCRKGMKGSKVHHHQRYNIPLSSSGSSGISIPGPSTLAPVKKAVMSKNPAPSSSGSCIPGPSAFSPTKKGNISKISAPSSSGICIPGPSTLAPARKGYGTRNYTPSISEDGSDTNYQSTQRNHIFEIYDIEDDWEGKGVGRHFVEPTSPSNTQSTNAEARKGYTTGGRWKGKGVERPYAKPTSPSNTQNTHVEARKGYTMDGRWKGKGVERPHVQSIFPSASNDTNTQIVESYNMQGDRKGKGIQRPHVESIFPSVTQNTNAGAIGSYIKQGDRKGKGIEQSQAQPIFPPTAHNTNAETNRSRQQPMTYPRMGPHSGPSQAAVTAHHTLGNVHGGANFATHQIRHRPRTPYPRHVRSRAFDTMVSDTHSVEDMATVGPLSIAEELAAKLDVLERETGYRIPVITEVSNVFQVPKRKGRFFRRVKNVLRAVFVL